MIIQNNIEMLGVINITPNSFSDGGSYHSLSDIRKKINYFRGHGCLAFDFGAESTAPFNPPISSSVELERFQSFLCPLIKEGFFTDLETLSIDTYKSETMLDLSKEIRHLNFQGRLIWNDVSGIIDEAVEEFISSGTGTGYVFSHNLVPKRELTSCHMDYSDTELNIIESVRDQFKKAIMTFHKLNASSKLILDPCFGFAKNQSQNIELLAAAGGLRSEFSENNFIFGISRKSFMQSLSQAKSKDQRIKESEYFHHREISKWRRSECRNHLFVRLHDALIFDEEKAK